jgi:hypothetical protein
MASVGPLSILTDVSNGFLHFFWMNNTTATNNNNNNNNNNSNNNSNNNASVMEMEKHGQPPMNST